MSNADQWRWADPTGQQRLVRTDELRAALSSGAIPPNAPVWRHGWKEWRSAQEVPELQSSALAAQNGLLLNIPPPPMFVVAAQSEFEAQADAPRAPQTEPPPPPRYQAPPPSPKPAPVVHRVAHKPSSSSKITAVKATPAPAPVKPAKAAAPFAATEQSAGPPPLPQPAFSKSSSPTALAAMPTVVGVPSPLATTMNPGAMSNKPVPLAPATLPELDWTDGSIAPEANTVVNQEPITDSGAELIVSEPSRLQAPATVHGVPAITKPGAKRIITPVNMPAPPPRTMPPRSPSVHPPPLPAHKPQSIPPPKNPTLMLFGGAPGEPSTADKSEPASPIVVPPPEPSEATKNAVTRPPPWFDGEAKIEPQPIPRHADMPRPLLDASEELSGSVLLPDQSGEVLPQRPTEQLSSSDLQSESSISVVVKPVPLSPSGPVARPNSTIMGMAPPPVAKPAEPRGPSTVPPTARQRPPSQPPLALREEQSPARSHDLSAILKSRPNWQLAVAGGLGLVVLLGLFGIVAHVASSTKRLATSSASAPPAASSLALSAPPPVASSAAVKVPPPPPIASCSAPGSSHVMAPKAVVASGVEARVSGTGVSLGFAASPRDGLVLLADPSSMSVSQTLKVHSNDPIKRVQMGPGDKPAGLVDVDKKGDEVQGRRALVGQSSRIDVGAQGGALVYAQAGAKTIRLFDLLSDSPVEALRGDALPQGGFVIAFRQGKSVAFGTIVGDPVGPKGSLARIDAKGSQVGSPSVAVGDGVALAVWAEKSDNWSLRIARIVPGDPPDPPVTFDMPPGGLGEQALSPSLAALPGGASFLLVWTEGPTASHQVRAIVLDAHGKPSGSAFTVSEAGVNAGQGQAAVLENGKGVVAFLASSAGSKVYQVVAAPIECAVK